MHPYSINLVYQKLTEEGFDITGYDAELTAHGGILSINEFINDLEKLYTTALFYETLEDIYVADESVACNLYKEGKYFEIFATEPYDNYGELLDKLIERIPDFNIRLKANPKTNHIEFR